MQFDVDSLTPRERRELLTGVVVPRPIALVSTISTRGDVLALPLDLLTCVGHEPPLVAIGIGGGDSVPSSLTDLARNVALTRELVVNAMDDEIAAGLISLGDAAPPGRDVMSAAVMNYAASVRVRPPGVAEAPVRLECRQASNVEVGGNRIVLAEVLYAHVRDDLLTGGALPVRWEPARAVGSMEPGWYVRCSDRFRLPGRPGEGKATG